MLAIPAARVAEMQRTIAMHAHCMHYVAPDGVAAKGPRGGAGVRGAADAFDVALGGAWLLSRGEEPANATLCTPRPLPAGWAPTTPTTHERRSVGAAEQRQRGGR